MQARAWVVGVLASTFAVGAARNAQASPLHGRRFHVGLAANEQCTNPSVEYFGGPIVQSPVIVAVFWNSGVNATLQANIGQFYTDVTSSSYFGWLQEYDTVGLDGGSPGQAVLPGSFGGAFTISPSVCPGSNPCQMRDSAVQAELIRQIGLGVLPAPTVDCTGNVRTVYMVDFPPNVTLNAGGINSCASGGFCGYHSTTTVGAGTPLVYAALMDTFTGPCSGGCGTNPTGLENATDLASHELVEAVTDPDIGLDTQSVFAAPAGWGDNRCGEVADICDDHFQGDPITVNGRTWVVQEIWSNQQNKCTSTGPVLPACAGTTLNNCRACSCADNGGACSGGAPVCETHPGNVLFGACEACTADRSGVCAAGTSCVQSSNSLQDDVCSGQSPPATPVPPWTAVALASGLLALGASAVRPRRTRSRA
jgi:hypothetical protein